MTPPDPDTPFAALGIAPSFHLDGATIDRAYLARAAALHPDLADPSRADEAARASARLNEARATLADPERRANALLALLGGPSPSDDRSLPDGFLMEMMDARQQAQEECVSAEGLARWRAWAAGRRGESIREVAGLFDGAGIPPRPGVLGGIRRALNAWRYVERMIEQLDPAHAEPVRSEAAQTDPP